MYSWLAFIRLLLLCRVCSTDLAGLHIAALGHFGFQLSLGILPHLCEDAPLREIQVQVTKPMASVQSGSCTDSK